MPAASAAATGSARPEISVVRKLLSPLAPAASEVVIPFRFRKRMLSVRLPVLMGVTTSVSASATSSWTVRQNGGRQLAAAASEIPYPTHMSGITAAATATHHQVKVAVCEMSRGRWLDQTTSATTTTMATMPPTNTRGVTCRRRTRSLRSASERSTTLPVGRWSGGVPPDATEFAPVPGSRSSASFGIPATLPG